MDAKEIHAVEAELEKHGAQCPFPRGVRAAADQITVNLLALCFPHFAEANASPTLSGCIGELDHLLLSLRALTDTPIAIDLAPFWKNLPNVVRSLWADARATHFGDPASASVDEVILAYPGFLAIAVYRLAHELHILDIPLLPRLMTEEAHRRTGVDIHPGAKIGHSFCIDHGTGVVIGGTADVGNGVKIYQGVTLGASSVERSLAHTKRHPTIEDNVVIYANATILGGTTVIGHDSVIGGSAWITHSIPPFSIVGRDTEVRLRPNKEHDLEFNI